VKNAITALIGINQAVFCNGLTGGRCDAGWAKQSLPIRQ